MTDKEVLKIFVEASEPALATGEVAVELGMSQQGAYSRLDDLVERGLIGTKKFGQGRGWWITDKGLTFLDTTE